MVHNHYYCTLMAHKVERESNRVDKVAESGRMKEKMRESDRRERSRSERVGKDETGHCRAPTAAVAAVVVADTAATGQAHTHIN